MVPNLRLYFIRGVVLGHIDIGEFGSHLRKELFVGSTIGILSSIFLGIITYIWQGSMPLALTTSLSMLITIVLASLVGYIVPWILIKAGQDSAAASDPLITTVKDITGLIIYFALPIYLWVI